MTLCPRRSHLEVDGQQVPITNPDKVVFPGHGVTKLDLVRYYLASPTERCAAWPTGR